MKPGRPDVSKNDGLELVAGCIAPDEEAPTPHHKLDSVLDKPVDWMERQSAPYGCG
jgi:hypothetical protein